MSPEYRRKAKNLVNAAVLLGVLGTILLPKNAQGQSVAEVCDSFPAAATRNAVGFVNYPVANQDSNIIWHAHTGAGADSIEFPPPDDGDYIPSTVSDAHIDVTLHAVNTDTDSTGNRTITVTAKSPTETRTIAVYSSDAIASKPDGELSTSIALPSTMETTDNTITISVSADTDNDGKNDAVGIEGEVLHSRCGTDPNTYNDLESPGDKFISITAPTPITAVASSDTPFCGKEIDPIVSASEVIQQPPLPTSSEWVYLPTITNRICRSVPVGQNLQGSLPDAWGNFSTYSTVTDKNGKPVLIEQTVNGPQEDPRKTEHLKLQYNYKQEPYTPPDGTNFDVYKGQVGWMPESAGGPWADMPADLKGFNDAQIKERLIQWQHLRDKNGEPLIVLPVSIATQFYLAPNEYAQKASWLDLFNSKRCGGNVNAQAAIIEGGGWISVTPTDVFLDVGPGKMGAWINVVQEDFESCNGIVPYTWLHPSVSTSLIRQMSNYPELARQAATGSVDYPPTAVKVVTRTKDEINQGLPGTELIPDNVEVWVPAAYAVAAGGIAAGGAMIWGISGGGGGGMPMFTPD